MGSKKNLIPLVLLIFVPIAIAAAQFHWDDTVVFATSAIAIIPLSIWLSTATEKVAVVTGPTFGALVNAVFGNATILIVSLMALREGLIDIVEATITGSILCTLLLLLGLSMLAGGLRYKEQSFSPIVTAVSGPSMTLAVIALALPTIAISTSPISDPGEIRNLSVIVSTILIVVYGLTLIFSLGTHSYLYTVGLAEEEEELAPTPSPQLKVWIGILIASTLGIAAISGVFVDVIKAETDELGFPPLFTGAILLPMLSDVASGMIAIRLAIKNQMNLTVCTTTGDSLLLALFVAPVLVLVGQAIGQPIDLYFHPFEVIALAIAVAVTNLISFSGRSTWLDGILLIATYLVLGVAFYYQPS